MFHPSQPVTSLIEAVFKSELKEIPIFRREFASAESRGTIEMSPDLAEPYDSYRLQLRSVASILPYDSRHQALNNMDRELSISQHKLLATHTDDYTYERHYQLPFVTGVDLQSLFAGREPNMEMIENFQIAFRRSSIRDTNAPTTLNLKERTALEMEPELIQLRIERIDLLAQAQQVMDIASRKSSVIKQYMLDEASKLHAQAKDLLNEYNTLWNREYNHRLAAKREIFFGG
ncbi:hypothetical protein NLI96_g2935 [Meripilus lineatus]|uniref:Uncharacterized protein n=1 Tax=Meripilus lineatus TaxID=2056292 RepID=A0AAD5YLG9_9APHY|nr:hypothetical protein NLI96_g2935 [Physisporinus lineatus]